MRLPFSSSQFTKTLLLLVLFFVLFNAHFDATAAPGPIIGEGTKGYISKWVSLSDTSSSPTITCLDCPTQSTGYTNTSYTFTFTATDPQGDQIRYGVDWDMDGTADDWLPAGVTYVNSGVSQSIAHSWLTTGAKTFQALTQDYLGLNSSWTSYNITISSGPIPGVCGTANKTYPIGSTSYGSDTFCAPGTAGFCSAGTDPNCSFPTPGGSVTWVCNSPNGGPTSDLCRAILATQTYSVNVVPTPTTGGLVKTTSDTGINCGLNCFASYNEGSTITLQAIPNSSYWQFVSWGGDCSGTNPICVLNINGNKNVTATFTARIFDYREF